MSGHRVIRAMAVVAVLLAPACNGDAEAEVVEPASVEELGPDLWQVTLTDQAAERTGVATTEVAAEQVDGAEELVVPYSSIMYHFDGSTWVYTNPEPLVYVREMVELDHIEGDVAVLSDGPAVGTTVVTVGAAELYGVEFGVGK